VPKSIWRLCVPTKVIECKAKELEGSQKANGEVWTKVDALLWSRKICARLGTRFIIDMEKNIVWKPKYEFSQAADGKEHTEYGIKDASRKETGVFLLVVCVDQLERLMGLTCLHSIMRVSRFSFYQIDGNCQGFHTSLDECSEPVSRDSLGFWFRLECSHLHIGFPRLRNSWTTFCQDIMRTCSSLG